MENNVNERMTMFDRLPDEMVLKIFQHLEDMTDLENLPKVDSRFKELSELRCDRNHLIFNDIKFAGNSPQEIEMNIETEMNKCMNLKFLTCTSSNVTDGTSRHDPLIKLIKRMFMNSLNQKNEEDIDKFHIANSELIHSSFLKKNADTKSNCKIMQLALSNMSEINADGTPNLFLSAIRKNTNTLRHVIYKAKYITYGHLHTLGMCNRLEYVTLKSNSVISEEVPVPFRTIQARVIILSGNFSCPHFANIFSGETLEEFGCSFHDIIGVLDSFLARCTTIREFNIDASTGCDDIRDNRLINSIVQMVDRLKSHGTLELIKLSVKLRLLISVHDSLSRCLESNPHAEIKFEPLNNVIVFKIFL